MSLSYKVFSVFAVVGLSVGLLICACAPSKADVDNSKVIELASPTPGYKCFGIYEGARLVGGNCIKE